MRNLLLCFVLVCGAGLAAEPIRFELPACVHSARIVAQAPDAGIRSWVTGRAATLFDGESLHVALRKQGLAGIATLGPIAESRRLAGISIEDGHVTADLWRALAGLPGLRELSFGGMGELEITDGGLIAALAELERLSVENVALVPILQGAAKLPNLRQLRLPGSSLSSRDVCEALMQLRGLTSLDVRVLHGVSAVTCITELPHLSVLRLWLADKGPDPSAFLDALAERATLRRLDIRVSHAAPEAVIRRIASIQSLEELRLETDGGAGWTDALLASLADLPRLRSLHVLHEGPLTGAGIAAFAKTGCLEELCFWRVSKIDDAGAAEIATIRSLRKLCIRPVAIGTKGLVALSALSLHEFELVCDKLTDPTGLRAFARMTTLEVLDLDSRAVDDSVCEGIGKLTNLVSLTVNSGNVTSAGAAHFGALHNLRKLNCTGCTKLGDRALRAWAGLSLHRLEIKRTGITDRGMAHVAGMRTLRHLDVSLTGVSDAGLAMLKDHPNLMTLSINDCPKLTAGCGPGLAALPKLRLVFATGCRAMNGEKFEAAFAGREIRAIAVPQEVLNEDPASPDDPVVPPPKPPEPADPPDNDLN